MSDAKILILAAVAAGGAVFMMNRAKAATRPAGSASAPIQNKNVNDQLWTSILGGAWKVLNTAKNQDGTIGFLKKNFLGQTVTSDGKPVSEALIDMFPATYGDYGDIDYTSDVGGGGEAFIDNLFPLTQLEW